MPRRTSRLVVLLLAALLAASGCAGPGPASGRSVLVLAGGGVSDDNDAVIGAMLAHLRSGDTAMLVPFASAEQGKAAESATARFRERRPDVRLVTLADPHTDPVAAAAAVEQVREARLFYFTGGDQSRITARLLEPGPGARLLAAMRVAQARGAVFAGTSAGTAVMSRTMFTGGGSESALADLPADDGEPDGATPRAAQPPRGVRLAPGMGMLAFDDVIMDSHAIRRGRVGRMVAALARTGVRFGIGVADDRGVRFDGRQLVAIGDNAVMLVDAALMERVGGWRNLRLSVLSDGDRADLDAPERWSGRALVGAPVVAPSPGAGVVEAWGRDSVLVLLRQLAENPGARAVGVSERFELSLSLDDQSRVAIGPGGEVHAHRVRLDIAPRSTRSADR